MALLDQGHYGAQFSTAVVNTGIIKTIPVNLFGCIRSASTTVLNGTIGAGGTSVLSLTTAAGYVLVDLRLPSDYDDRKYAANDLFPGDTLKLRVSARPDAGIALTNLIDVTGFASWRPGTSTAAAEASRSSAQTAAQTVASGTLTEYEFDLSGLGLRPGDIVTAAVQFTAANGSSNPTDSMNIHGIEWQYRGHIIQTDSTDR